MFDGVLDDGLEQERRATRQAPQRRRHIDAQRGGAARKARVLNVQIRFDQLDFRGRAS